MNPLYKRQIEELIEKNSRDYPNGLTYRQPVPAAYLEETKEIINSTGLAHAIVIEDPDIFGKFLQVEIFRSNFDHSVEFDDSEKGD